MRSAGRAGPRALCSQKTKQKNKLTTSSAARRCVMTLNDKAMTYFWQQRAIDVVALPLFTHLLPGCAALKDHPWLV